MLGVTSYTAKIDEWAIGCIVLEMFVGQNAMPGRVDAVCSYGRGLS